MSTDVLYTKGARVWIRDPEVVWRGAELLVDYKGQKELDVEYEDGEQTNIAIKTKDALPPLRNPEILIGENDLTSLSYLHEPAVLYNLQVRFCERNAIYTYCGIVLVALNPYEQLPIYGPEIIQAYSGQDMGTMDPHVFAVAEEAFKNMSRFDQNQSIIVSGESGAGKTVSAKYAMRYFAAVGGSEAETNIEKKVLASNPIMEAIGNAKTIRNDNSSRFGKYIEIAFDKTNKIVGANMRTYLLEKSRLTYQAADERNYHIFYQLCASSELPEFEEFRLDHQNNFFYTNQGQSPIVDGVDDAEELETTREAMSLLGISEKEQMMLFRILTGILYFGNVIFDEKEKDGDSSTVPGGEDVDCTVQKDDTNLIIMCDLLGIDCESLRMWLCNRKIATQNEVLIKPLKQSEAINARDALAKHIYSQLFDWIVSHINKSLKSSIKSDKFIGVLDIYGFETFEVNSFEQFCINYANEKLQQQFNRHVFILEQEEYNREKIEWSFIDFYDNQPCIDLIENKLGILDLLDEECKMPKGSDQNWCQKLYSAHGKAEHFEKPRMSNSAFIIHHFADNVQYTIDGFLEKNRDTVLEQQVDVLKASKYELVGELFSERKPADLPRQRSGSGIIHHPRPTPKQPSKAHKSTVGSQAGISKQTVSRQVITTIQHGTTSRRKTVGSQFRDSLKLLMATLSSTTPHYIRCIKPNDYKEAFEFEPKRAVQQLRACGVLETIRISAAGYPSRWTYQEFISRYRVLATSKQIVRKDTQKSCKNILEKLIQDPDKFQFGKTKIFFRAGQVAYLEKLRADKLRACGVMIQKHIRGWLQRRKYVKIKRTVLLSQMYGRGFLARKKALFLRRTRAATTIQKHWRGYIQYTQYMRVRCAVLTIQAFSRGMAGRKVYRAKRSNAKAIIIQARVRGWLARRGYKKIIYGIVKLQSHVRRRAAKKELKRLKIEARSVDHIKTVNKGLENKIIELQQRLDENNKEVKKTREEMIHYNELKNEMESLRKEGKAQKLTSNRISELEAEIELLRAELASERKEKNELVHEKEKFAEEHEKIVMDFTTEKISLKEEVEELNRKLKEKDAVLKNKVSEAATSQLEYDNVQQERAHHQMLVKEHGRLQQRCENLQNELGILRAKGVSVSRSTSNASSFSVDGASPMLAEMEGETGEEIDEKERDEKELDLGYGSERRKVLQHTKLGSVDWKSEDQARLSEEQAEKSTWQYSLTQQQVRKEGDPIALVIKLQNRVKELEKDRSRLLRELEHLKDQMERVASINDNSSADKIRADELELEKNRLNAELMRLRKVVAESAAFDDGGEKGASEEQEKRQSVAKEFMDQFEAMTEELERRREECIQLKAVMANRNVSTSAIARESYHNDPGMINDDGELAVAYKTMKDVNRLLEDQLQKEKALRDENEQELRNEIQELKRDNERQQKLIGQNLTLPPGAKIEATMQHEITRMTGENLDLREQIDTLQETIKKLKKAVKIYAKRLKNQEGFLRRSSTIGSVMSPMSPCGPDVLQEIEKIARSESDDAMPSIKYQEREYRGMLEYKKEDEPMLVKNLIIDLKPKIAVNLLPGLPAYVLFMCIRHTDSVNDDDKVRTLLSATISGIKKVVKKRHEDVETVTMWLGNTCRLLHNLKQYSGEKAFQSDNTMKQNEHCLQNFDLSEYRQVLSDLAVWIYQGLIKLMQQTLQPMIVSAILEHEAISGLSGSKPTGMRGRTSSNAGELEDTRSKRYGLDSMMKMLNHFHKVLQNHGIDPELVKQVFTQLLYFICAGALNNLLLRKEMCHWSKGMQIRYNISHVEQWMRDNKLQEAGTLATLEPIIQASQLLQARKSESDVESIAEMCSKLTVAQIVKILNLYTPVNEFEERVPIAFIRKIQEKLKARQEVGATLLMDTKLSFPVTFPFNPSSIGLETLQVPEVLSLAFLKRV
ncbi:unconventional myosin-Va-like isoform X4 [Lineus longissimus]|uniref:unconventional myosin-Va-like isoform X4 n=1 Tax=Lineus longissimus TaxID=88925 RepID=UPI00315C8E6D